jgi:hypothetical protein
MQRLAQLRKFQLFLDPRLAYIARVCRIRFDLRL